MSDLFRHNLNIHSSGTILGLQDTCNIHTPFPFRKHDRYLMDAPNHYLMLTLNLLSSLIFCISFLGLIICLEFHFFQQVLYTNHHTHNMVYENKRIYPVFYLFHLYIHKILVFGQRL